jgi:hypothetical protein
MKRVALDYVTYAHAIEVWRCGCDCVVRRTMKEVSHMIEYPNGRIEGEERK